MKKIIFAIVASLAATVAGAQTPIALGKPATQEPAVLPAAVNPMTGRSLGYEQRLRSFEEAQVDAKIAEEQLREKRARAELARVDRDSRVSAGAGPLPLLEARFINETGRAPRAPQAPARLSVEAPPVVAAMPPPPRADPPRVAGVLRSGTEYVALMEFEGKVTQVREGDTWQGKRMEQVNEDQVVLGGTKLRYQPQDSRFVVSDPDQRSGAPGRLPNIEAGPFGAPRTSAGQPFNPALNRALEGQTVPRAIDLPQPLR